MSDNVIPFPGKQKKPVKQNNVVQLNVWTNIKLYLNKLIGTQWILAFKQKEGGVVVVNNPSLTVEEAIFICEVVKNVHLNSSQYDEPEDPSDGDDAS